MSASRDQIASVVFGNNIYPIYKGFNRIGRDWEATVVLTHPSVSKLHAIIIVVNKNLHFVCDIKSTNGTYLNGSESKLIQLNLYELNDGDTIFFGKIPCKYRFSTEIFNNTFLNVTQVMDDNSFNNELPKLPTPSVLQQDDAHAAEEINISQSKVDDVHNIHETETQVLPNDRAKNVDDCSLDLFDDEEIKDHTELAEPSNVIICADDPEVNSSTKNDNTFNCIEENINLPMENEDTQSQLHISQLLRRVQKRLSIMIENKINVQSNEDSQLNKLVSRTPEQKKENGKSALFFGKDFNTENTLDDSNIIPATPYFEDIAQSYTEKSSTSVVNTTNDKTILHSATLQSNENVNLKNNINHKSTDDVNFEKDLDLDAAKQNIKISKAEKSSTSVVNTTNDKTILHSATLQSNENVNLKNNINHKSTDDVKFEKDLDLDAAKQNIKISKAEALIIEEKNAEKSSKGVKKTKKNEDKIIENEESSFERPSRSRRTRCEQLFDAFVNETPVEEERDKESLKQFSDSRNKKSTTKNTRKLPNKKKLVVPSSSDSNFSSASTSSKQKRVVNQNVVFIVLDDPRFTKIVKSLGGTVVDTVQEATILIKSNLKRTYKLLMAIALGKPICSPQYLIMCEEAQQFLDPWDYILQDDEGEARFNISLKETLLQSQEKKVLEGYSILVTCANAAEQLKSIIEASGGKIITNARAAKSASNFIVIGDVNENYKYSKFLKSKAVRWLHAAKT